MSANFSPTSLYQADAEAFGLAVEGLLCQAPLADPDAESPTLDFSGVALGPMFDAQFPDVRTAFFVCLLACRFLYIYNRDHA